MGERALRFIPIMAQQFLVKKTTRTAVQDAGGFPDSVFERLPHTGSGRLAFSAYSVLWVPSQKGGFFVCLQLHSHTFLASGRVNFFGPKPVPLWLPSHIG